MKDSIMKLFKLFKKRSFRNNLMHALLNIGLATALLIIIQTTESLLSAILLILISKWRVFAVRPRFWIMNLQSNLVDYIVGLSLVVLMYLAHVSGQTAVVLFYFVINLAWLLYLKPKSKRTFMHIQAGSALFLGVTALFSVSYDWWASVVVLFVYVIGYAVSRHILYSYDESQTTLLSLVWGIIFAEFGWVVYHWTVSYAFFGLQALSFPRAALSLLCLGFISERAYDSYDRHKTIRWNDLMMPVVFTACVVIVLPLMLSLLGPNIPIGL